MRIFLLLFGLFTLVACQSKPTEVPTDALPSGPEIQRLEGTVSNIREVKQDASLGKQFGGSFIGALVGGQIGGGTTSAILGTSGAFIGQDVANQVSGKMLDRLILTAEDGKEYECPVHGHDFKLGDKVVFTLVAGHVSAIIQATPE
ncbi:hypothetical protein [Ferrimonas marina]|uniref:Outer membrane lipoprotein SlyB n=1 Tax=Ferrimonas marina TaxID=299255 RepID=A0A1M5RJ54_9GAMM|nr:hypothetical protein [Ferrimonas marina]SHH25833.1 hypothetical protein SAMN02745129_1629 [Ferrimonas marina]